MLFHTRNIIKKLYPQLTAGRLFSVSAPHQDSPSLMISTLKTQPNSHIMQHGNNILHQAVHHAIKEKDVNVFDGYLKNLDALQLSKLSRQTNEKGDIPYDLVLQKPIKTEFDLNIMSKLLGFMALQPEVKPLNKQLTGSMIFCESDTPLQNNLKLGRIVANEVRTIVKQSSTHPVFNGSSSQIRQQIYNKINKTRENLLDLLPMETIRWLKLGALAVMKSEAGNCEECSYVALDKVQKLAPKVNSELYRISNGDHCFLVIDRNKGSNRYDWRTWGEHTVICDAWLGDVYSVREIPEKLVNSIGYRINSKGEVLNFITTFNQRFHRLKPLTEFIEKNSRAQHINKKEARIQNNLKKIQQEQNQAHHTERENRAMIDRVLRP